jgi:hypothetical protein
MVDSTSLLFTVGVPFTFYFLAALFLVFMRKTLQRKQDELNESALRQALLEQCVYSSRHPRVVLGSHLVHRINIAVTTLSNIVLTLRLGTVFVIFSLFYDRFSDVDLTCIIAERQKTARPLAACVALRISSDSSIARSAETNSRLQKQTSRLLNRHRPMLMRRPS